MKVTGRDGDNMQRLSKAKAKRYLEAFKKINKKYITVYDVAQMTGIVEQVIQDDLAYFDPFIRLDPTYDLSAIFPKLNRYAGGATPAAKGASQKGKQNNHAAELPTLGSFVYEHMTMPGGIIDRNISLSLKDLKLLKKIINATIKGMKK